MRAKKQHIVQVALAAAALVALAGCGQNPGAAPAPPTPVEAPTPLATTTALPAAPTVTPLPAPPTAPPASAPATTAPASAPTATPLPPAGVPATTVPTALPTALPTVAPSATAAAGLDGAAIVLPSHVTPVPGWLHTAGTRVVDAGGRTVTLATVNWYGAEGPDFIPGGLDKLPYMQILLTIRALGFNSVRLPFSNELVERNPRVYAHLEANRELIGQPALSIMDTIVEGARRAGLMVILDDHRSDAGWSALGNGRWYAPQYPETSWINDWVALAQRYRDNPAVVGFDLRNEPHSNGPGTEILGMGYLHQGATWGPFHGLAMPESDWRMAAQRAGNAILQANPHLLIIVEGTEIYPNPDGLTPDIYWWGGNLRGAMAYPVQLDLPHHLVYSAHEYGPQMHSQRWITAHMTIADWQAEMDKHWGALLARTGPDAAPVWIGEFGTPHHNILDIQDTRPGSQGQWFTALIQYIKRTGVGWSYWAINGTMSSGPNGRQYGEPDSFGLLTSDWRHVSSPLLLQALRSIEPAGQ